MADKRFEKQGLKHLERIESELEEIKDRTSNPRRAFFYGILYGAGAFVGGIIAIVVAGWILSILGVIPGFDELERQLGDTYESVRGR